MKYNYRSMDSMKGFNVSRQRGSALIEFALVSVLLFLLLLGIVEFGLILKDYQILNEAARVGARSAAVGYTTGTIQTRVRNTAVSLDTSKLTILLRYSTNNGNSFAYIMGNSDDANDAPIGSLVRVRLIYRHRMISTYLRFGSIKTIQRTMIVTRE